MVFLQTALSRNVPSAESDESRLFRSLQAAHVFPVVFFGGGEATNGNTSAVRRLAVSQPKQNSNYYLQDRMFVAGARR